MPRGAAHGFAAAIVAQAGALTGTTRAAVRAHFDLHLSPRALGRKLVGAYQELAAGPPLRA